MVDAEVGLLERSRELDALRQGLDSAVAGGGRLVVVEGPAGIGKSRLLDACAEMASESDVCTLAVRGDEVVMDSSFAAVRELFWEELQSSGDGVLEGAARLAAPVFDGSGDATDPDRVAGVLHGLYWLVANLGDRRPLVLLIDDAHWLDPASVRFAGYLARRLSSLPVLLVVASRPGEEQASPIGTLAVEAADVLHPEPLSEDATAALIRNELGLRADEALCRSCHDATGGNPFYLRELTTALQAEGGRPTVELAERVRMLGAGSLGRSVLVRLARLGPESQRLAESLATLAPGSPLRHAAALAELDRTDAERAADALRAVDLVAAGSALRFAHPIVREAVAAELAPSRRAAFHARAARLLRDEGARADQVAAHLLSAEPFGEGWVVDALREAARQALAQGAPETAVAYLRRALEEPPPADVRLDVLVELGTAEARLPEAQDFASLREALALASDPRRRVDIGQELIAALLGVPDNVGARAVAEEVLERSDGVDPVLVERLEGHLIGGGAPDLNAADQILQRLEHHLERARRGEVRDPVMLAALAMVGAVAGRPAAEIAPIAEQAVTDENLTEWTRAATGVGAALSWIDLFASSNAWYEKTMAKAQAIGHAPAFVGQSVFRGATAYRAGDLADAEAHGRRAFELGHDLGSPFVFFSLMWLPGTVLEAGKKEEASALVEGLELPPPVLDTWHGAVFLAQRGRVRVAMGELEQGLADLQEADRRMRDAGYQLSVLIDWVPPAASALAQLGRREEGLVLAERELEEAIAFGTHRRHGIALSTCGLLDGGEEGLMRLREAVDALDQSGARLEHARALVNLGIGLRSRGEPEAAREPLTEGLDLAHRCGAVLLAEQARSELVATGARPRREAMSGPAALTPAELRTARMAAEGLTNREIAQALFVSTKTVEWQLSHAYSKLGIKGRGELSSTFAADPEDSSALGKPRGRAAKTPGWSPMRDGSSRTRLVENPTDLGGVRDG